METRRPAETSKSVRYTITQKTITLPTPTSKSCKPKHSGFTARAHIAGRCPAVRGHRQPLVSFYVTVTTCALAKLQEDAHELRHVRQYVSVYVRPSVRRNELTGKQTQNKISQCLMFSSFGTRGLASQLWLQSGK